VASLFDKLESEAFRKGLQARSKEADKWFSKNVKKLGKLGPSVLKDDRLNKTKIRSGDMVMYTYNPKHKQTLPYYDTFPLSIIVGKVKGGFTALNLHYLPPKVRAIFLDKLNDVANNQKFDDSTKFKITYKPRQNINTLHHVLNII
jgi:mRNA-degrading endonuclease RelE of RelBE toxin-antitoxin system